MPTDHDLIASHVKFTAQAGRGDELLAAVEEMFPTAADEPGTLVYAAHRVPDEPDAVVMYELYASSEAQDAHGQSDAAARFGAALDGLLAAEPEVWTTRPVRALGLPVAQGRP